MSYVKESMGLEIRTEIFNTVFNSTSTENLSVALFTVMDLIGASEVRRKCARKLAVLEEIMNNTIRNVNHTGITHYIFGSYYEGTFTFPNLCDKDHLICHPMPVEQSVNDACKHDTSLLIVTDNTTMPGYVKLQIVMDKVPRTTSNTQRYSGDFEPDQNGWLCITHNLCDFPPTISIYERNGPACTHLGRCKGIDIDYVGAFRCKEVPEIACSWMYKKRQHNWPSLKQLSYMKSKGCFFVGVGHPSSCHKSIEWRISFSLQERELMTSLTPVQHKCFVLLKMIKRDIIHPRAGKSISSYHCKTCLFYTIESTPAEFWTKENCLQTVFSCLRRLLQWTREGNCPNYFVPKENMFDRLDKHILKEVAIVLQEILSNGERFLILLLSDYVTKYLKFYILLSSLEYQNLERASLEDSQVTKKVVSVINVVFYRMKLIIEEVTANKAQEALSQATKVLHYLQQTDSILKQTNVNPDHKTTEVKNVFNTMTPHIHLQIAQCLAACMDITRDTKHFHRLSWEFQNHLLQSNDCDLISPRLVLATWFLLSEKLEACERILKTCEKCFDPFVMSMCSCYSEKYNPLSGDYSFLTEKIWTKEQSTKELRRNCTALCMIFPPSQANIVPTPIRYEYYRAVLSPPPSVHVVAFFNVIVVDSKVYLLFLQYILYTKLNKPLQKQEVIRSLQRLIETYPLLGHIDIALNLLGWIYAQEDRIQEALECFRKSLRRESIYNAAKWHLLICLAEMNGRRNRYCRQENSLGTGETGLKLL